jgi:hypothetical protein
MEPDVGTEAGAPAPRSGGSGGAGDGRVGLYAGFCADATVAGAPVAAIHLGLPSPTGSSGLPAGSDGPSSNACAGHHLAARALLGLAPGGVYRAIPVTRDAGGLLPHRFTLTGPFGPGGLFSVALSRGSPRVAVSNHPALWSPDVPRQRAQCPHDAAARPTRPSPPVYAAGDTRPAAALLRPRHSQRTGSPQASRRSWRSSPAHRQTGWRDGFPA